MVEPMTGSKLSTTNSLTPDALVVQISGFSISVRLVVNFCLQHFLVVIKLWPKFGHRLDCALHSVQQDSKCLVEKRAMPDRALDQGLDHPGLVLFLLT